MVEVDDRYILFAVVGNHSVAEYHQHQVENSIEMFLDVDIEAKPVHAHNHDGSELLVMAVGVDLTFF